MPSKDAFFEMAVRIVAANIQAGQFNELINLPTIASDYTVEVFEALVDAYSRCGAEAGAAH